MEDITIVTYEDETGLRFEYLTGDEPGRVLHSLQLDEQVIDTSINFVIVPSYVITDSQLSFENVANQVSSFTFDDHIQLYRDLSKYSRDKVACDLSELAHIQCGFGGFIAPHGRLYWGNDLRSVAVDILYPGDKTVVGCEDSCIRCLIRYGFAVVLIDEDELKYFLDGFDPTICQKRTAARFNIAFGGSEFKYRESKEGINNE